jgi:uroporphyrin-III C-methyltransferase
MNEGASPPRPSTHVSASSAPSRPRCALVGAGPGDPELLTIKATRAIRDATVLLVDDLVSDSIVALASPSARVVRVGKRGGCRSTPQAFIERLMIRAALRGERVVRLKGGDPCIFGRGGEEAEALRARGIDVEMINGITSGLAAATSLGVPLTHRDHAHGVILVTGHARDGAAPLHWPALASAAAQGLTLVVYMGVSEAKRLQDGLLEGLPPRTPIAIVQNASQPAERRVLCTLGALHATIQAERIASPAIIIVGNVLAGLAQWQSANSWAA